MKETDMRKIEWLAYIALGMFYGVLMFLFVR